MAEQSEKSKILIVDDNPEIREILRVLLGGEGYFTEEAGSGQAALDKTAEQDFDLIILDIMMPGIDGYKTCIEIRKNSNAPILFLSAKSKESDKTMGFLSGGDDYLAKPFSYNELISRAKALIRRYQVYRGKKENSAPLAGESPSVIRLYDVEINEKTGAVTKNGRTVDLTDTEYALLILLIRHRHQIFSAERLYEAVWKEQYYYGAGNTIMVHIRNLRRKIEEDPKNPVIIKTVWGRGYRCD